MSNEKSEWKPEVGEKAWIVFGENVYEAIVSRKNESSYEQWYMSNSTDQKKHGFGWMDTRDVFPTAEAAYHSFVSGIKVYDLEGKEVVIPRAEPDFSLDEMVEFFNKWIKIEGNMRLFLEAQGKPVFSSTIGKYMDRAKEVVDSEVQALAFRFMLTDEAGHQNYTWEQCLEMARREIGGRGANGGKSDQREGGC